MYYFSANSDGKPSRRTSRLILRKSSLKTALSTAVGGTSSHETDDGTFNTVSHKSLVELVVLFLSIIVLLAAAVGVPNIDLKVYANTAGYTVVIDAGHGGKDRGASGRNGVYESDINLAIARFLKREFEVRGVGAVMTRETGDWLASSFAPNKKKDDMNERRKIIENTKPELVISIHLNTFPGDSSVRGLQCFYDKSGEISRKYAEAVQTEFNKNEANISRTAKTGDYYILDCTEYPSVLVECGFLSNAQDEKILKTGEYQRVLAHYIASAVVKTRTTLKTAEA